MGRGRTTGSFDSQLPGFSIPGILPGASIVYWKWTPSAFRCIVTWQSPCSFATPRPCEVSMTSPGSHLFAFPCVPCPYPDGAVRQFIAKACDEASQKRRWVSKTHRSNSLWLRSDHQVDFLCPILVTHAPNIKPARKMLVPELNRSLLPSLVGIYRFDNLGLVTSSSACQSEQLPLHVLRSPSQPAKLGGNL